MDGEILVVGLDGHRDFVSLDGARMGDRAETKDCGKGDLVPVDLAAANVGGLSDSATVPVSRVPSCLKT